MADTSFTVYDRQMAILTSFFKAELHPNSAIYSYVKCFASEEVCDCVEPRL